MKLLKSVNYFADSYEKKLVRMNERVNLWMTDISKEKRIGLAEADPYNSNPYANRLAPQKDDSIDFTPQGDVEKPVQPPHMQGRGGAPSVRIHLVYNPKEGKIEKVIKTPVLSRPPAEYMEANAEQVRGALKHLNTINPELAQKLVRGDMSVWIPRALSNVPPGLPGGSMPNRGSGGMTTVNMDADRLANARKAAGKMSLS